MNGLLNMAMLAGQKQALGGGLLSAKQERERKTIEGQDYVRADDGLWYRELPGGLMDTRPPLDEGSAHSGGFTDDQIRQMEVPTFMRGPQTYGPVTEALSEFDPPRAAGQLAYDVVLGPAEDTSMGIQQVYSGVRGGDQREIASGLNNMAFGLTDFGMELATGGAYAPQAATQRQARRAAAGLLDETPEPQFDLARSESYRRPGGPGAQPQLFDRSVALPNGRSPDGLTGPHNLRDYDSADPRYRGDGVRRDMDAQGLYSPLERLLTDGADGFPRRPQRPEVWIQQIEGAQRANNSRYRVAQEAEQIGVMDWLRERSAGGNSAPVSRDELLRQVQNRRIYYGQERFTDTPAEADVWRELTEEERYSLWEEWDEHSNDYLDDEIWGRTQERLVNDYDNMSTEARQREMRAWLDKQRENGATGSDEDLLGSDAAKEHWVEFQQEDYTASWESARDEASESVRDDFFDEFESEWRHNNIDDSDTPYPSRDDRSDRQTRYGDNYISGADEASSYTERVLTHPSMRETNRSTPRTQHFQDMMENGDDYVLHTRSTVHRGGEIEQRQGPSYDAYGHQRAIDDPAGHYASISGRPIPPLTRYGDVHQIQEVQSDALQRSNRDYDTQENIQREWDAFRARQDDATAALDEYAAFMERLDWRGVEPTRVRGAINQIRTDLMLNLHPSYTGGEVRQVVEERIARSIQQRAQLDAELSAFRGRMAREPDSYRRSGMEQHHANLQASMSEVDANIVGLRALAENPEIIERVHRANVDLRGAQHPRAVSDAGVMVPHLNPDGTRSNPSRGGMAWERQAFNAEIIQAARDGRDYITLPDTEIASQSGLNERQARQRYETTGVQHFRNVAEEIGHGAEVVRVDVDGLGEQWGLRLTPEAREYIRRNGLSMFSVAGGAALLHESGALDPVEQETDEERRSREAAERRAAMEEARIRRQEDRDRRNRAMRRGLERPRVRRPGADR